MIKLAQILFFRSLRAALLTVLHTESSTGWGGQENRTLNEARELRRLGCRVLIATRPGAKLAHRARGDGFEVFEAGMRSNFDLAGLWTLVRLIGRQEVDVVSTHSGRDSFLAGLAGRLSPRRPRVVRTRHLALPITSKFGYSRLPHRVVAVSHYVRRFLIEQGVPSERIVVVPTAIDIDRYGASPRALIRQELGIPAGRIVVGTVAILRGKKGHRYLLEAIKRVVNAIPDALFLFVGDGPQRANIEKRIAELGLHGSVRMLGLRDDVPDILAALDLFVLPTLQEALGTSYIEAMASGLATVGTTVGGVPEVVKHGETGLLVPPAAPEPLADAILALLRDPARRAAMGAAGRRFAEEEWSLGTMGRRMLDLYQSLVAAK